MTMPLFDGRFVSRAFFVPIKNPDGNILAFVYKDEGVPTWTIHLRFRYYARPHESADRSYSYEAEADETPGPSITKAKLALDNCLKLVDGGPIEEVIVESSIARRIFELIHSQEWGLVQGTVALSSA